MRFLLTLLIQFNFNLNGDYLLDRNSLEEYALAFGQLQHSFLDFKISADFLVQQPSQWDKRLLMLSPQFSFKNAFIELALLDFQAQFQKGLVFSQLSDFQFRKLRYVRGIELTGKLSGLSLTLLSGQLASYDYENFLFLLNNDTSDVVRALNLNYERGITGFEATYVRLNRKNMPESYSFQEIYGLRNKLSMDWGRFEINLARKWGVDPITYSRIKGLGVNVDLAGSFDGLDLGLSGIYYDSINFWNYNLPPVITEKELLPNAGNADKGLSFLGAYGFGDYYFELQLASIVNLRDDNLLNPSLGKAYQEGYFKFEGDFGKFHIDLKVARETYLRVEPEYQKLLSYYFETHSKVDAKKPTEFSLKVTRNYEDSLKYWMTEFTGGVDLLKDLTASFQIEYASMKIPRFNNNNFWANFELLYRFENGSVSLAYGKKRGGLVCSGGMCRILPSFDGLKLGLNIGY